MITLSLLECDDQGTYRSDETGGLLLDKNQLSVTVPWFACAQLTKAVETAERAFGPIDVLIANAGAANPGRASTALHACSFQS